MNTYMLLLYADEKAGMALPKEAMAGWAGWMEKMQAYAEALEKAGAHVAHGALGPTSEATTVTAPRARCRSTTARSPKPRNSSAATT